MPKLLCVETSSPVFSVAVGDGERILSFLEVQVPKVQPSTNLTELISEALQKAGCTLASLDGFAISIGPGSFTGLRVGVMTVKTLAWALKKPILPISSLEVIAWNVKEDSASTVPFVDARKGKVYTAIFSGAKRLCEDKLLLPEQALENLPSGALLVGDGLQRYAALIAGRNANGLKFAPPESSVPRADELCRIASSRWPEGLVEDPHQPMPQYLYSQESDITGW
jgi:tRNA threonylcarbamoyladenosine biosynthesis protein TsaB